MSKILKSALLVAVIPVTTFCIVIAKYWILSH